MAKQGRSSAKCYGCIFSCLTVRAVHIEVTQSLSTDSFLDAFRRFIGRRGKPLSVLSDNAGCFVGADRVLRESIAAWNQAAINEQFRQKGIQWVFNPPLASHFGGCYERMIRSMRQANQPKRSRLNFDKTYGLCWVSHLFFYVLNSFLKTKQTAHMCGSINTLKHKDVSTTLRLAYHVSKNLVHMGKTRQVNAPRRLLLLGSRFTYLLPFQTAKNRKQRNGRA